eukprot:Partr_v1_DN24433_c1_g1_i1_m66646 putative Domain of unknown function (DUF2431)
MAKQKSLKSALQRLNRSTQSAKRAMLHAEKLNAPAAKKKSNINAGQQQHYQQFEQGDRILLIGEANFSFALALANLFKPKLSDIVIETLADDEAALKEMQSPSVDITATTLDPLEVTLEKYPDASENMKNLNDLNVRCLSGIDGTQLEKYLKRDNPVDKWEKIVFNFPHVGAGIKDQERNVIANQQLIFKFMESAKHFLAHPSTGEIHISIKQGSPYDEWGIKDIAKLAGLQCKRSFSFDHTKFPGYAHRRTLGFKEGLSKSENEEVMKKGARTFIFAVAAENYSKHKPSSSKSRKG